MSGARKIPGNLSSLKPIFVVGYPKSGVTWVTRILGDLFDCPTGGYYPGDDSEEIASEGYDRPGEYIVRKGHYIPTLSRSAPLISSDLQLSLPELVKSSSKVVFVVRDPRDMIVSGAYYFNTSIQEYATQMIEGTLHCRALGSWNKYVQQWIAYSELIYRIKYEEMHDGWDSLLLMLSIYAGIPCSSERIERVYERQSFDARVEHIRLHGDRYNKGKEFNLRFMRRGSVGDWREHFDRETGKRVEEAFGDTMRQLGYVRSRFWWKGLR